MKGTIRRLCYLWGTCLSYASLSVTKCHISGTNKRLNSAAGV